MKKENDINCSTCSKHYSITDVLALAQYYWKSVNVVVAENPCCRKREELQIQTGKIKRGYVYAAGEPHFCGMEEYKVKEIRLMNKEPFTFLIQEKEYQIETK